MQKTDPWPDASIDNLNRWIKEFCKHERSFDYKWVNEKPERCSTLQWRRSQFEIFLTYNPDLKGKAVFFS